MGVGRVGGWVGGRVRLKHDGMLEGRKMRAGVGRGEVTGLGREERRLEEAASEAQLTSYASSPPFPLWVGSICVARW